ncbi:unnamed protein product [Prorocentrum cordatum]|uniref:Uncharacterized protein n=1 Tax=Prorocentrum cordatum TaxID=2364126 RepID=A0ABN9SK50_9DINO|nr:unnamed protein product [Polarella glacialis]
MRQTPRAGGALGDRRRADVGRPSEGPPAETCEASAGAAPTRGGMACLADARCEIAAHLDVPALLAFGAGGRALHRTAARVADDRARRSLPGVEPLPGWGRGPYWKRLGDALRPRRLVFNYCGAPPDCTCLLGAALSTQASWFLEFEMTVFASSLVQSRPLHLGQLPRCCTASLNWNSLDNSSNARDAPIKAGFSVTRQLSFYRGSTNGQWRSSGVILRDLPGAVVPAVFMSSFVGHASVSFVNLRPSPPNVECKECDLLSHGLKNGWCSCLESGWCSCSSSKQ